jgi:hypothetical protein
MDSDIENRKWSPELLKAAQEAVDRNNAEKAKLAAMTPEQRKAYISEWSKRLAAEWVEIGERGVGCACCDPDVKAKLKAVCKCGVCTPDLIHRCSHCGAMNYDCRWNLGCCPECGKNAHNSSEKK